MDRYDVVALIGLVCLALGGALQLGAPLGLMILGAGLIAGAVLGARTPTQPPPSQTARQGRSEDKR